MSICDRLHLVSNSVYGLLPLTTASRGRVAGTGLPGKRRINSSCDHRSGAAGKTRLAGVDGVGLLMTNPTEHSDATETPQDHERTPSDLARIRSPALRPASGGPARTALPRTGASLLAGTRHTCLWVSPGIIYKLVSNRQVPTCPRACACMRKCVLDVSRGY